MIMKMEDETVQTMSARVAPQNCDDEVIEKFVQEQCRLFAAGKLAAWKIERLEHIPGWSWGDAKSPFTRELCVIGFDWCGSRVCAWLADAANADQGELLDETEEEGLSDAATRRAVGRLRKRAKELGYRRVELRNCTHNPFSVVSRSSLTRVAA
jgi:hypothetical protein